MHVEHFMTKDPVACDVSDSVADAARQMRDKNVGCVVVLRNGKVAGLLTDRQIAVDVVAEDIDPDETTIEAIMVEDPARLEPDDDLYSAVDTLRSAGVVRRAPVVNAYDELIGLVSISDVAVVTDKLISAILLEETHHSLREAHLLTGAKRIIKRIRRPTKDGRLPPDETTHVIREPTPRGPPSRRGNVPRTRTSR